MVNEISFNIEEEEEPLEPLRMEHFYLSFIFLGVGLFLSASAFIVEIIKGGCQAKGEAEDDRNSYNGHQ